jgi:hypothetical protein
MANCPRKKLSPNIHRERAVANRQFSRLVIPAQAEIPQFMNRISACSGSRAPPDRRG